MASQALERESDTENVASRVVIFVNIAHALDHFSLLIYPTAIITLSATTGLEYGSLIPLTTGAFAAFGLLSLPVGLIANAAGQRTMLTIFFFGLALSCGGWR